MQAESHAKSHAKPCPLCIDLDGTLIKTDLLFESLARLLKQKPWLLFLVPLWCLRGRAALKKNIACRIKIDIAALPYHADFLDWLHSQKAIRPLLLVTAADELLAKQVADHLGLFDRVLASDGRLNLKGKQKLKILQQEIGGEFEYAGNSRADLEIWRHCNRAITVGASFSLVEQVRREVPEVTNFHGASGKLKHYFAALRVHQWVKNILIFVPLITSHQFLHPPLLFKSTLGILLFSLCSSAQYILNDLMDLDADRRHPTKRRRRFASGEVSIATGLVLAPVLLTASLTAALIFSKVLALVLVGYFSLSFCYSLYIKRVVLLDAFVLAGLYMVRIIAGNLVTGVAFSVWLLSFAFFLFLSLAFSKRWTELNNAQERPDGAITGRGYQVADREQVNLFGVCSGFLATVVFILYLQSDNVRLLYRQPQVLWLLAPIFLYWVSRIWILASRGKVSEDPIIFVLRDRVTYVVAAVAGLVMMAAAADWSSVILR